MSFSTLSERVARSTMKTTLPANLSMGEVRRCRTSKGYSIIFFAKHELAKADFVIRVGAEDEALVLDHGDHREFARSVSW